jgi:flagellar assembly factor FliW
MPQARTKHFAILDYDEGAVLTFPVELPGFEHLTRFLMVEHPDTAPLTFLQSLESEDVCLPALAVLAVDPDYELALTTDDLEDLGFTAHEQIPVGNAIGCFAIISVPADGPATANLQAPVVVNLAARRAVQAVRLDTRYSHQHPIARAVGREDMCS